MLDDIFKFGLHDTRLHDICVDKNDNALLLYFNDGVYSLNELGKESKLTNKCVLKIFIDTFYDHKVANHVSINEYSKKNRFLELYDFTILLQKEKVNVGNVFISFFNHAILFTSGNSTGTYYIEICDCVKIEYMIKD